MRCIRYPYSELNSQRNFVLKVLRSVEYKLMFCFYSSMTWKNSSVMVDLFLIQITYLWEIL